MIQYFLEYLQTRHYFRLSVNEIHSISNRYLDLKPVCERGATAVGKPAKVIEDEGNEASYFSSSTWVLVSSDPDLFKSKFFSDAYMYDVVPKKGFRAWTDDYSNLFQILDLK